MNTVECEVAGPAHFHSAGVSAARASGRSVRGGPSVSRGVFLLAAALLAGVVISGPVTALEAPVQGTAAATPTLSQAGLIVAVGAVERPITVDWARARLVALDMNPGRTRLAPSADAALSTLAGQLALTGDQRERYLLFSRAADPKPGAADLQLSARVVRNALISAARAPQDAIVVASWTGLGDPPGLEKLATGASSGGFVLVPIAVSDNAAQTRALALDSAFSGVAELRVAPPIAVKTEPSASTTSSSADLSAPKAPVLAAVPAPVPVVTPRAPVAPTAPAMPPVAAARQPVDEKGVASAVPKPAPARPIVAARDVPASDRTGSVSSPSRLVAALLPLPKARPQGDRDRVPAALPTPRPYVAPLAPQAEAPRKADRPTARVAADESPTLPQRPSAPTPLIKAEPARRAPARVADCAPPRIILDDFYRGGPIVGCDGRRR